MCEWINIKDKHPEEEVVVVYSSGTYYPPAIASWKCGYGFKAINGDNRTCENVTHWLPIPKKPK